MNAPVQLASPNLLKSLANKPPLSEADRVIINGYISGAIPTKRASIPRRFPAGFGPYGEKARQKRVFDRAKSRQRKRTWGGDGHLPNWLRQWFTEGERAALSVIAAEVMKRGVCDLPIEKIASKAGVSVRTVQYAIATAAWKSKTLQELRQSDRSPLLLHVEYRRRKGARNLPNRIKIISREWMSWLTYQPSEAPALTAMSKGEWSFKDLFGGRLPGDDGIGCKKVHTSQKDIQQSCEYDEPFKKKSDGKVDLTMDGNDCVLGCR